MCLSRVYLLKYENVITANPLIDARSSDLKMRSHRRLAGFVKTAVAHQTGRSVWRTAFVRFLMMSPGYGSALSRHGALDPSDGLDRWLNWCYQRRSSVAFCFCQATYQGRSWTVVDRAHRATPAGPKKSSKAKTIVARRQRRWSVEDPSRWFLGLLLFTIVVVGL